jgi:hypothetical protein
LERNRAHREIRAIQTIENQTDGSRKRARLKGRQAIGVEIAAMRQMI